MSRRTAESNKAIQAAWKQEQELVKEGKGTREWTPKQQEDILEKGKAYDDDGIAFQGQHMKSAAMYPEYQGDPKNIQFLTREEHLEAHDGNWRNPTNWYYDPITKEKTDFGSGPFIPCKVFQLHDPVIKINVEQVEESENDIKEDVVHEEPEIVETTVKTDISCQNIKPKKNNVDAWVNNAGKFVKTGVKTVIEGVKKNPKKTLTKISSGVLCLVGACAAVREYEKSKSRSNVSNLDYNQIGDDDYNHLHNVDDIDISTDMMEMDDYDMDALDINDLDMDASDINDLDIDNLDIDDRPYTPNDVPPGWQRYHYKDGVKWKEKPGYHRGK